MSVFPISPDKEVQLAQRMARLGVRAADLEETFTRSGGPGGQNVNKVASAAVLIHRPTGLQVRCEQERSQYQNRLRARELLLDKIEDGQRAITEAARAQKEKLRRQNRKPSRAARQRMLEHKARRSAKKRLRRAGPRDE